MKVKEVMTQRAEFVDPATSLMEAAQIMKNFNLGALPVGENDRLIGMVTDRDIVVRAVAEERSAGNTTVRQVMSQGICYCFENDDAEGAAQVMAKHQVRRLPVLNRDKRLVGVIALADLGRSEDEAAQGALKDISQPSGKGRR